MAQLRLSDIAKELNADPARFAPEIIGEEPNKPMSTARELRFYKKGGLAVTLQGPKRGNWRHHGHDKFGDMLDLIMYIRGKSRLDALAEAKRMLGIGDDDSAYVPAPRKSDAELKAEADQENIKRISAANFIWGKAGTGILSNVDAYLAGRGITIHRTRKFKCMRYRRLDNFSLIKMGIEQKDQPKRFPKGLTALVFGATRDDGSIGTVQQVILDGAAKADIENKKRSNGIMDDCAVRFDEPKDDLDVAEGPETGLSCIQATGVATWSSLGASNFTRLPIPDRVKRIRFAMEREPSKTGIIASLKGAFFWMTRGKDVALVAPRIDGDANDVLQKFGEEAVREDFSAALSSEINPFRDAANVLLSQEEISALPVIVARHADDALAAWIATGLHCVAAPYTNKKLESMLGVVPEGATKIVFVTRRDDEISVEAPEGAQAKHLVLARPLDDILKLGGGAAVRRLLDLAAPLDKQHPIDIEDLALMPGAPVIVATGKLALAASKELFPTAAAIGLSPNANSAEIDWSSLQGRKVYFAPANREIDIMAAEQAASDAVIAGASAVWIFRWPLIVPAKTGFGARAEIPDGYDLRWLLQDGWTANDARTLARLAERVLLPESQKTVA